MVAETLEVSDEEGEGAERMVMAGGQRQPAAPNVAAAAMKWILPEVQRKEEGKGGQGRPGTGGTGHGGTGESTGGQGGKAPEGRNRRVRQEPGKPRGTCRGSEEKPGVRGTSGHSHSSRLSSHPQDQRHRLAQR